MKVFQLLLILCLLFTLKCKDSKAILKCVINNASTTTLNLFMDTFNTSPGAAYALLGASKAKMTKSIIECK
jgi:hypothetical protein